MLADEAVVSIAALAVLVDGFALRIDAWRFQHEVGLCIVCIRSWPFLNEILFTIYGLEHRIAEVEPFQVF
jgi:hypothetical protein